MVEDMGAVSSKSGGEFRVKCHSIDTCLNEKPREVDLAGLWLLITDRSSRASQIVGTDIHHDINRLPVTRSHSGFSD